MEKEDVKKRNTERGYHGRGTGHCKTKQKPKLPSDVGMQHDHQRLSQASEGQLTANQICSKCSLFKIIVSQASEFVVNLTQKLIFF